jgi:ketosteroid isomerase-like protein
MATDTTTHELARAVAQLKAERDIMHTINRYSWAIDYGREDDYLDCFTEDGAYQVKGFRTSEPKRVEGRDALRTYFRNRTPKSQQKHISTSPQIDLAGDTATAETFFIGFNADDGVPQLFLIGRYVDHLRRGSDGAWRIAERIFEGENDPPKPK